MDLYREEILDHYNHPRNFGDLAKSTHTAREANASCGDLLEVSLLVEQQQEKDEIESIISDVRFKGIGCALSIAAGSLLTEHVKGKSVRMVLVMSDEEMVELMGIEVTATRMKCVTLPLRAFHRALEVFRSEPDEK